MIGTEQILMNANCQMCTLAWELAATQKAAIIVPAPKAHKVTGQPEIATRFPKNLVILLVWLSVSILLDPNFVL
jgi:hypothetical protein